MISWHVYDDKVQLRHLEQLPDKLVKRVERAIVLWTGALQRTVIGKVTGGVLQSRTGKLVAAIRRGTYTKHEPARGRIVGVVGIKGADKNTMIAAGAQEYGANIKARMLETKQMRALKFQINGIDVFAPRVQLPAIQLPARSFMRSSIDSMRPAIQAAINEAAQIESKQ